MHGETIQEDQGRNMKQPKQYKAPLDQYKAVTHDLPHDPTYRVQSLINTI
jgi:hypothetical protein